MRGSRWAGLRRLWLGSLLLGGTAAAAPEAFNPDRPTAADNPLTVPQGAVMVELGSDFGFYDAAVNSLVGGTVRVGLAPEWELRVGLPTLFSVDLPQDDTDLALGDVAVGAKHHLPVTALDLGVVAMLGLPTATSPLDGPTDFDLSLALNAYKQLTTPVGVGGHLGLSATGLGDELDLGLFASGYATLMIAQPLQGYAQVVLGSGFDDANLGTGVGVFAVVAKNVQLDLGIATGLTDGFGDLNLHGGASIQF